jgi:hypothetical protein
MSNVNGRFYVHGADLIIPIFRQHNVLTKHVLDDIVHIGTYAR